MRLLGIFTHLGTLLLVWRIWRWPKTSGDILSPSLCVDREMFDPIRYVKIALNPSVCDDSYVVVVNVGDVRFRAVDIAASVGQFRLCAPYRLHSHLLDTTCEMSMVEARK